MKYLRLLLVPSQFAAGFAERAREFHFAVLFVRVLILENFNELFWFLFIYFYFYFFELNKEKISILKFFFSSELKR